MGYVQLEGDDFGNGVNGHTGRRIPDKVEKASSENTEVRGNYERNEDKK